MAKTKNIEAQDVEVLSSQSDQTAVELYAPVKQELSKFNVADDWIAKKKEEYAGLVIAGIDDKDGYAVVHSAYMEIKNKVTDIEKTRAELKQAWSIKPGEIIDNEAKRLKAELIPLRDQLQKTRDDIDAEKERIKKQKEKEKAEKLQARILRLVTSGMTKEADGSFSVRFSDAESDRHVIDSVSVMSYSDEQFNVFASLMELKAKEKREAEEKKKKDDANELERLRAENARLAALVEPQVVEVLPEENSGSMSFGVSVEYAIESEKIADTIAKLELILSELSVIKGKKPKLTSAKSELKSAIANLKAYARTL